LPAAGAIFNRISCFKLYQLTVFIGFGVARTSAFDLLLEGLFLFRVDVIVSDFGAIERSIYRHLTSRTVICRKRN
jgi:hypothetical protein